MLKIMKIHEISLNTPYQITPKILIASSHKNSSAHAIVTGYIVLARDLRD